MDIVGWAVRVMGALGGPGVALLLFLENLFPPIPSEVILPLAGVTAGQGTHSYWVILAWTLVGSLIGAWLLYFIGHALGATRVRRIFEWIPLLDGEDFDASVAWFQRHGTAGIFFGRMVPAVRSVISIPAGIYGMPLPKFTALTLAGSAIWNTIFVSFGFYLGENWHVIEPWTDVLSLVVYAVLVLLLVWFVVQRIRRNRRQSNETTST